MPSTSTDRLAGLTTSVAVKAPCRVATTANITLSGLQTVDGVSLASGDRVLVKNQSTSSENGIYMADTGYWFRTPDFDGSLDAVGGTQVHILAGSANANTYWKVGGSASAVTIGTDAIAFVEARLASEGGPMLEHFGAVGDGVTDDTAAVQAFLDYLAANHLIGTAPKGSFLVSETLTLPETYGWGIIGAGMEATIFVQATDNIPVLELGATPQDAMHSYVLRDLQFTYSNNQPAANTAASCILFSAMGHQGMLKNIRFYRGHYGIKVASGIPGPWGQDWDNLRFYGELSGGAMDWTGVIQGVPNNKWGRMIVHAGTMTDAIFKEIKGYNWTIGNIEILDATDLELLRFQAGSSVEIGSIKLEIAEYTGSVFGNHLIFAATGTSVRLGSFFFGGTTAVLTPSVATYLFGGSGGRIEVGHVDLQPSAAVSNFYVLGGSKEYLIRELENNTAYAVPLTNVASSAVANTATVLPDKNDRLADNKGDADYTIAQGDPGTIPFETTLTASRTVALPVDAAKLFNGLRYRVLSKGAVNGANTLVISASATTKATIRDPYGYVDMEWRRHPSTMHLGWQVIGTGSIRPDAHAVVPTANLPAAAAAMDGTVLIEDAGAGDRNLIVYAGSERFRIDGGAAF